MHSPSFFMAFVLTTLAGLSTMLGSFLVLFTNKTSTRVLSVSLGFSAGVMVYVSFMELLPEARLQLASRFGNLAGSWYAVAAFFGGVLLIGVIDKLVPAIENPHETHAARELKNKKNIDLLRTGTFTALAIAIHNFPEGMATFTATLKNGTLGLFIAMAIAIHNIPEGIAVAVPIYHATGSKRKALWYSFLSAVAEPLGAVAAYLLFHDYLTDAVFGIILAAVAGIMVFISFDELFPTARECGQHHLAIYGLLAGMAVMAVSMLLFVR